MDLLILKLFFSRDPQQKFIYIFINSKYTYRMLTHTYMHMRTHTYSPKNTHELTNTHIHTYIYIYYIRLYPIHFSQTVSISYLIKKTPTN